MGLRRFLSVMAILLAGTTLSVSCDDDHDAPMTSTDTYNPTPFPFPATPSRFPAPKIPADNPITEEGVALGRHLFYEKMLSIDNSTSCGSCHKQEFGFADSVQFSKGVNAQSGRRNSMALANLVYDNRLFWDGRASSLEEQALIPIQDHTEMGITLAQLRSRLQNSTKYPAMFHAAFGTEVVTEENVGKALGQFVRTLVSFNSRYDKGQLTPLENQGLVLFSTHPVFGTTTRGGDCMDCHALPLTTDGLFKNNGLDNNLLDSGLASFSGKPTDVGLFKTVSLRNIELTGPYMHDGRFETLEEVLDQYSDHIALSSPNLAAHFSVDRGGDSQIRLLPSEKQAIIAFLKTLTDDQFINDPKFSDPNL